MNNFKIRSIKTSTNGVPTIIVIDTLDTFENLSNKAGGRYFKACIIRPSDNGEFVKNPCITSLGILDIDIPCMPTPQEYHLLSLGLKKYGYRFNKKTGELIEVDKKNER